MVTQANRNVKETPFVYENFWDKQEEDRWGLDCIKDKMLNVWGETKDE